MHPELFSIPFFPLSIKSYGFMMTLGFIAALFLARRRCKLLGQDPNHIDNFGVLTLIAGVVGARLFHVAHHWSSYKDNLGEIVAIWSGGLEFLGGFILASVTMLIYFRRKKLPILQFLDILAPAVMLGLAFGRIGCLLNGCCFGAPSELPWAIRFPAVNSHTVPSGGCQKRTVTQYSHPYDYQLRPDNDRRPGQAPIIQLPDEYYAYTDGKGNWAEHPEQLPFDSVTGKSEYFRNIKPPTELTAEQLYEIEHGKYRMHPIHPAQLYSCANALLLCLVLNFLFRYRKANGQIFALLLIFYGCTRFGLEALRTSSPYEFNGLTISQNLGIIAVPLGIVMFMLAGRKSKTIEETGKKEKTKP